MALLLLAASAWVPSPFSYRWGLPADARSFDGLGGGIAWALDPSFCKGLSEALDSMTRPL